MKTEVGEVYKTKTSGYCEVISIESNTRVLVRFEVTGKERYCAAYNLRRGEVKDHFHPSVYGVGYLGKTYIKSEVGVALSVWRGMLSRCYYNKNPRYKRYGGRGVIVCEEWKNFSTFLLWFNIHYRRGFELDKDLLVRSNKVYCPQYCCFIPKVLNTILSSASGSTRGEYPVGVSFNKSTGKYRSYYTVQQKQIPLGLFDTVEEAFQTYKEHKTAHIKTLADTYLTTGDLDSKLYNSILNYEIVPFPETL